MNDGAGWHHANNDNDPRGPTRRQKFVFLSLALAFSIGVWAIVIALLT